VKRIISVLAVLCAAGFSACGDKGADGPVGTWVLDSKGFFDANREMFKQEMEAGLNQAKAGMEQINQAMAQVPEAQRAELMKAAREQMMASAGEHRDVMEAYLRSPEEARKLIEQKARTDIEKQMQATMTFKGDKSWTGDFVMMGQSTKVAGTWSATGDQVTLKTTKKNDQPATGDDAKTLTMTVKGDVMSGKAEEGLPITLVMKRK
jgi:hypothetical protein